MTSPAGKKIQIKHQIVAALNRDGEGNVSVIASSLALEHGFTKNKILEIVAMMEEIELIERDGDVIRMFKKE